MKSKKRNFKTRERGTDLRRWRVVLLSYPIGLIRVTRISAKCFESMWRTYLSFFVMLAASWCVMATTHELGHVVSGILSGGKLVHAELRPWKLPHSHFMPDPQPLVTLWGGPILGVTVPLLLAMMIRRDWGWFIADFCLIAGGTYIALAWISHEPLLDTARLLKAGAAQWQVGLFCLVTIVPGYVRFRRRCIDWLRSTANMSTQKP